MVLFLLILFIASLFALGLFLSRSYLFLLFDYASYLLPNISVSKRSGKADIADFVPYVDMLYELDVIETKTKYQLALEVKTNKLERVITIALNLSDEFSIYLLRSTTGIRTILFLTQQKQESKGTWLMKVFPFLTGKWIKLEKETLIKDLVELFRKAGQLLDFTRKLSSEEVIELIKQATRLKNSSSFFVQLANNHAKVFKQIEIHNSFIRIDDSWTAVLKLTSISLDKNEIAELSKGLSKYEDELVLNFLIKKQRNEIRLDVYIRMDADSIQELKQRVRKLQTLFSNVPGCAAATDQFTPILTFCASLPAAEPTTPTINLGGNHSLLSEIVEIFNTKSASSLTVKHSSLAALPFSFIFTNDKVLQQLPPERISALFINMENLPAEFSAVNSNLLTSKIHLDKRTQNDILEKTVKMLQEFNDKDLSSYYKKYKGTAKTDGQNHLATKIALELLTSSKPLKGKSFNILLSSDPVELSYQLIFLSTYIKAINKPTFIFLSKEKISKEIRTLLGHVVKQNPNCKLVIVINENIPVSSIDMNIPFLLTLAHLPNISKIEISSNRIVCVKKGTVYIIE